MLRHLTRQLRHHAPGMYAPGQHTLLPILGHDELCETRDCELAGLVAACSWAGCMGTDGGEVDDGFVAGFEEEG